MYFTNFSLEVHNLADHIDALDLFLMSWFAVSMVAFGFEFPIVSNVSNSPALRQPSQFSIISKTYSLGLVVYYFFLYIDHWWSIRFIDDSRRLVRNTYSKRKSFTWLSSSHELQGSTALFRDMKKKSREDKAEDRDFSFLYPIKVFQL